ncbi:MAG: nucleotide-diphospho-sugar transferase [Bacteroidales bacterium]
MTKYAMSSFQTPILFIVFNRPEIAQRVFDEIKKQKPTHLFIAADAPRKNNLGDIEKCAKTRAIIEQIDWACELKTLFQTENLGVAHGPSTAITWFFKHVEQGLILEDDCLPHPDFFPYCETLLEKYKNDSRMMYISGLNTQNEIKRGDASYYFSIYGGTWGWATWRDSWTDFDLYLKDWSLAEFKHITKRYFHSFNERMVHTDKYIRMKRKNLDAWDYQYMFLKWRKNKLAIVPNVNLISNIGIGTDATHFASSTSTYQNLLKAEVHSILPLIHPKTIEPNIQADKYHYTTYLHKNYIQLLWRWIYRTFFAKKMFD